MRRPGITGSSEWWKPAHSAVTSPVRRGAWGQRTQQRSCEWTGWCCVSGISPGASVFNVNQQPRMCKDRNLGVKEKNQRAKKWEEKLKGRWGRKVTRNCGKFLKRWEYQTTLPASWEICMQVKKQQLELDRELVPNWESSTSRLYIVTLLI